jgi:8-oxo-dGTP pyrophosphatase MutT (NUDIX family)
VNNESGFKMAKQVAALPIRRQEDGELQIMLVTSRGKGQWLIPKGWPMKGLRDRKAAAREAKQEAGVSGKVARKPLGSYKYAKGPQRRRIRVKVFVLLVKKQSRRWREAEQRRVMWSSLETAANTVGLPSLRRLINSFAKRHSSSTHKTRRYAANKYQVF